ncbi:hypothetical protein Cgig2_001536 [Carnegiea gigantea]|uniref:ATP synthase protein MI25 n=1 Tax=Carnegiea gigantea TaxID=171969 RepID=A0A9Q1GVF2_9CARY|nr:hypothetical protein Cgig2_001536 [Carnegiea gigantea]
MESTISISTSGGPVLEHNAWLAKSWNLVGRLELREIIGVDWISQPIETLTKGKTKLSYPFYHLRRNTVAIAPESNKQQRLLRISLRICGTVVESLPMARCAPKCEKTVQALLCRNLNVKSATLPNATSSRRTRLQDDLVTGMQKDQGWALGHGIYFFPFKTKIFFFFLGMPLCEQRVPLRAERKQSNKQGEFFDFIHVFLVPLARTKLSHVRFVITTLFFDVKDQKPRANSHWILVVLNNDGYSFKSLGSTTRSSTRWKFSYSLCTCSCGSDEYSCLYRYDYKHFLVPINKTSSFSSLLRNRYRNGCLLYLRGGFRGRPIWGTFCVWDARLTSVFISFLIYLGALCFQKLPVEPATISIRAGPIDIPIIKSPVNWWNTSHQPGSISRSGTSTHVPMPIPILSNFANFLFSTRILFVLETRLPIPSFLESPLMEEIEAREGILKPSSLAESRCIHG